VEHLRTQWHHDDQVEVCARCDCKESEPGEHGIEAEVEVGGVLVNFGVTCPEAEEQLGHLEAHSEKDHDGHKEHSVPARHRSKIVPVCSQFPEDLSGRGGLVLRSAWRAHCLIFSRGWSFTIGIARAFLLKLQPVEIVCVRLQLVERPLMQDAAVSAQRDDVVCVDKAVNC